MSVQRVDESEELRGQTADERNGCLSVFVLPPAMVLMVGLIFAFFVLRQETPALATRAPAPVNTEIAPLFTPEVQYWRAYIQRWAAESGLDANLIATVMQIESCGDPQALSGAGAAGLFQVMPFHFLENENPYLPTTNALRGLAYLKKSLDIAQGDAKLALAGYNGGVGIIGRAETAWAAETIRYAYWGSGIYADALQGATVSARLNEWLARGGAALCQQANARLGID